MDRARLALLLRLHQTEYMYFKVGMALTKWVEDGGHAVAVDRSMDAPVQFRARRSIGETPGRQKRITSHHRTTLWAL